MSNPEANALTWFEIPATDFDRATKFYEQLLQRTLQLFPGPAPMKMFPYQPGEGIGGAIVKRERQLPGARGTVVYLRVNDSIDAVLERASGLGASVLVGKTAVPGGRGFYGLIADSEGNCVGLHAQA